MTKNILKLVPSLLFFSFLFLFPILNSVQAQTYSLSIWPPLLEVTLKPGKSVSQTYKISNFGDDQIISLRILPFEPQDETGNIHLLQLPNLLNPLTFTVEDKEMAFGRRFLLKSGESKDLVLTLYAPLKTGEKDFYASLVLETNPEPKAGASEARMAAKLASNLLITVSDTGTPLKNGRIAEFSAPKIIDSFSEVPFKLKIENTGHSFFKPFGKITVEGILNQKGEVEILPKNILSGYAREMQVSPWKEKFILGPFKATVELTLDEDGEKHLQTITFLALPYKAILAVLVILLILSTFANLPKKKSKKVQNTP